MLCFDGIAFGRVITRSLCFDRRRAQFRRERAIENGGRSTEPIGMDVHNDIHLVGPGVALGKPRDA
jgi:hypothetical protein